MKVQSKKDEYIVKCENAEHVKSVMNFIDGDDYDEWIHWEYVIKSEKLKIGDVDFIEDSIKNKYSDLPVISFEEWESLPDFNKPEYDPKEVAFKPIGYKFKDDKIRNIVTAFLGDIKAYKTDSYDFPVKSSVYRELKELHVLDLWCDKVMFEKESEFNS